jgi:hypothetical protein
MFDLQKTVMPSTTDISSSTRRDISRRVRDAFPSMGIYFIRDKETGEVLVVSSRNVYGAINRTKFELRLRSHSNKTLQEKWNHSGPDRFDFEVIELLEERKDLHFDYGEELRVLEQLYREQYEQQAGAN